MEKDVSSDLFVNDGSFMAKFKQLQQGNQEKVPLEESKSNTSSTSGLSVKPVTLFTKKPLDTKSNDGKNTSTSGSVGKLAFSLKPKSKAVVSAIKLGADDDDDEESIEKEVKEEPSKRRKLGQTKASESSTDRGSGAPPPPSDPAVKSVADRLASFVAKNGRQLENITRQKNPGDTPFRFLFDPSCSDYKYYEYRILEEEKLLAQAKDSQSSYIAANTSASSSRLPSGSPQSSSQQSYYQNPASALYETSEKAAKNTSTSSNPVPGGKMILNEENRSPSAPDPLAMMEFYMKKAAQEERSRQPRQSKDEMPPPASLQETAPLKKGHHMGDYIPPEELQKFMASCNDAAAQKAYKEAAERYKIQSDNVGHRLLSKMGWREGEGLGSFRAGRADPVMAGEVKQNNLGVGAHNPGEVTPEDDIYEQYKKRMMLGYRYRPNPLNNPRKQYY